MTKYSIVLFAAILFCISPLVDVARADVSSPYGINTHLPSAALLDKVAQTGIDWIRVDFNWFLMEPSNDDFNWGQTGQMVNDARARDLEVFATLAYTPGWASGTSNITDPILTSRGVPI